METRGARNHNPLNIRRTSDKWEGLADVQQDSEFFQFKDDFYGFRAAFRIIHNGFRQGRNTVEKIVYRWAPPSENNSSAYVNYVASNLGISPSKELDYSDIILILALVQSMAYYESSKFYSLSMICRAYWYELIQ